MQFPESLKTILKSSVLTKKTIIDKIWDSHVVESVDEDSSVIYIDRHFIHEVTSPQAFEGLAARGADVFRPDRTIATADHNIPTLDQHLPIKDELSRLQVKRLEENCSKHNIVLYGLNDPLNGIVHVIGPEMGYTLPGMTIVCGDSHTSTHGAFGALAFGIGTSEVEMVLSSQCLVGVKPGKMRITIDGDLQPGVTSKDMVLYIISKLSTGGATGYFVEFAGSAVRALSMEARMTVCNMSIEMGARGGLIAPDEVTFKYLKGRAHAPAGDEWVKAISFWKSLCTDEGAIFDREISINAGDIEPMITYGTNPGLGIPLTGNIPETGTVSGISDESYLKSLDYMGFAPDEPMIGKKVDYVFLGSCTNGRIEDLRAFSAMVRGRRKADGVIVWIVPGSKAVEVQAEKEGLLQILHEAGFEVRQPGCSACLAMNDDKIPPGKYSVSTSNRNFEGRQGPGARTLLASPLTAAAASLTGMISDPRNFI
jgi:3-isopropylmalate/(R)-2-methylmalate dehydratase large subunit